MKEAMLYEALPGNRTRCGLCAHRCTIGDGKRGRCQVRENHQGRLYTRVYGRAVTHHADPVEKKPLFHFHPGSKTYSVATPGCNFRCRWCQNWHISQAETEEQINVGDSLSPAQIVAAAREAGCQSIAYTFTEPTVFFEYAYDTARLAHEVGLGNLFVTNGYLTRDTVDALHPYLDAANVDLKAFREDLSTVCWGTIAAGPRNAESDEATGNLAGDHHAGHSRNQRRRRRAKRHGRLYSDRTGS